MYQKLLISSEKMLMSGPFLSPPPFHRWAALNRPILNRINISDIAIITVKGINYPYIIYDIGESEAIIHWNILCYCGNI